MKLYCANCGTPLKHIRKALPKLGVIVDLIDYHECSETPIPFDLANFPEAGKFVPIEGKDKFVKSLNDLNPKDNKYSPIYPVGMNDDLRKPRRPSMTGTDDLHDRRFDQEAKPISTAPLTVLDQIKSMGNSIPAHDLKDDTTDSEMGG